MAVVWDSVLESEVPALTTLGGYAKYARENIPIPLSHQHHHHFHYPGGIYHTLGNLAPGLKHTNGDLAPWTPDADIRETKIAYYIELEVPGVSDKKAISIAWRSPQTLQIDGAAVRPDLLRGREGDGEPVWAAGATNGEAKKADVGAKDALDGGPCHRCADSESEMTTKVIRGERKIGSWRRLFALPVGYDMSTVKARLDAGLLHISVFKKEGFAAEGAKMVEVK